MAQQATVVALADELAKAVELIMHPSTTQQARMEAYMACERFKEESPLCAQVGLFLASGQYTQNVKHFGLQLMEYTIKFKWNCISQEEKIFIKEHAMKLLLMGVGPAEDRSLSHLKDALSRIIVEMIKREWPQQWTTLLSELSDASTKGEAQTELVLLVFLRLVEDVALLQTIESNQRRKDMYQALTNNMNDIFEFFLRLVELHVTSFREATGQGRFQKANAHSRVVEMVLLTLTGFVEWVSINHITCNNGKLLQILCILLNDKAFQCNAAECLSQITNRKGQVKERKPLLLLFGEEPMRYIYSASQMVTSDESVATLEQNHMFLKKLALVLSGMAQQLIALWGKEEGAIQRPPHFEIFLECLLNLTRHASLNVSHGSALIWNVLLKHDAISKDPSVLAYIPKVIEVVAPRIIKTPYPTARSLTGGASAATASYICMEYDSEEEFAVFFYRCRTDYLEIFRQSTLVQPLVTFAYCEQWLNLRLAKAHNERGNGQCSVLDPNYLEWEALVSVLDGVLSRILMVAERPSVQAGLRLLEDCLKLDTDNPLTLSIVLSCISTLFVFLSMSSCQITPNNCVAMTGVSLLPRVLDKIFNALVFRDPTDPNPLPHQTHTPRVQACKNLRRHAASLIVKLGHKYPLLLLPVFEQINTHIKTLFQQPHHPISKMDRVTLQEALLLISNHFCDYERQYAFIGEVMHDSLPHWSAFSHAFKSALDFMHFVGLDQAPVYPIDNDPCGPHRSSLIDALYIVLGVIKRCTWPDDPDRASRGGFVVGFTELGNPICRNPASPHVIPLLPHILSLLRVLNELFKAEAVAGLSEGYRNIHTMLEHEKKVLMGVCAIPADPLDPSVKKPPSPFDKMQQFMTLLYEGCYHMMGSAGPSLGRDLYQLQGVSDALINSAFACLDDLPDYRLRPIVRVFFKPFVYSCPPAFYDSVLLPIFAHISPIMCQRLTTRWAYITSLYESGQLNEEEQSNDTQEVLEDMLNRSLTREYLDVLKVALVGGQLGPENSANNPSAATNLTSDVTMDADEHSMDGVAHTRAAQAALLSDIISDLGAKLLRNPSTTNYILMTLLSALSWNDGTCNLKAVNIAAPVMRFLAAEQLMDANKAVSAFTAVLRGLQIHGQHEANQAGLITLGVQFYELLRPKFPALAEVLQSVPNVSAGDIQKFDEKISVAPVKGNKVDKAKKDIFKKLTAPLIGRSMNQLFRHEIKIVNLPPMPSHKLKNPAADIIDANQNAGLTSLFQATANK